MPAAAWQELEANIFREMQWAEAALEAGREGRARVCARRAVGHALQAYFGINAERGYGKNAVNDLRTLAGDPAMPEAIRHLARRLVALPNDDVERTSDPIGDGWELITYLFPQRPGGKPWR